MAEIFGSHLPRLQLTESELHRALAAARLQPGERYLEPGSGEGTGLIVAARDFGASARGIELHGPSADTARARAAASGVEVEVLTGDLREHDLGAADVVLLYLGPAFHDLLADQLAASLSPGTRVVSWGWEIPGWVPDRTSDELEQAWIYRPADPNHQLTWHAAAARTLVLGATIDAVQADAHAALHELDISVELDAAGWKLAVGSHSMTLARGQTASFELTWTVDAGAEAAASARIQMHSRGEPVGTPLLLDASLAGR